MASVHIKQQISERRGCSANLDGSTDDGGRWDAFRGYLHAVARCRAGEMSFADHSDVVQQTLLEAHQQQEAGKAPTEPRHYRHWLRQILCCNLADAARDACRQKRDVRREVRFTDGESGYAERGLPRVDELEADQTSPSRCFAREARELQVRQAIERLPDKYQQVIRLKFFENRPIAEIAVVVGTTELAVAGLVFRGMRKLREELLECGIEIE